MEENKQIERQKRRKRYLIAAAVAVLIAAVVAQIRGFGFHQTIRTNLAALCDGCFVSGVFIGGVGCLVWVSTTGFFDMLSYGFKNIASLIPFRPRRKHQKFYDYKQEKNEKRGKTQYFLLVIGLIMIALSVVFVIALYAQ